MTKRVEVWRAIEGFEEYYEVSNFGRVRSLNRIVEMATRWGGTSTHKMKGRILSPGIKKAGYRFVGLTLNGKTIWKMVHQLVAVAFIGPCPPNKEVAHDDNDKSNNSDLNLVYKTHLENCADRKRHGVERCGETVPTSRLKESEIIQIRKNAADGVPNHIQAAERGVKTGHIRRIVRREQWTHI